MGDRCTPARGPMDMQDAEGCHGTPGGEFDRSVEKSVDFSVEFLSLIN